MEKTEICRILPYLWCLTFFVALQRFECHFFAYKGLKIAFFYFISRLRWGRLWHVRGRKWSYQRSTSKGKYIQIVMGNQMMDTTAHSELLTFHFGVSFFMIMTGNLLLCEKSVNFWKCSLKWGHISMSLTVFFFKFIIETMGV